MSFDENAITQITTKLQQRLNRKLNQEELAVFSIKRSGIAYEIMLDYISDKEKSSIELEEYVDIVVKESI